MIRVSAAELKPGDRIHHPVRVDPGEAEKWRFAYQVVEEPIVKVGSWSLAVECKDSLGERVRISVAPTEPVDIERKGAK